MAPGDPRNQEGGWRLFDELQPEQQAMYDGAIAARLAADFDHTRALRHQVALALVLSPALHGLALLLGAMRLPQVVDWVPLVADLTALYSAAKYLVLVVGAPGSEVFWREPGWRAALRRLCPLWLTAPALYLAWLLVADLVSAPGLDALLRLQLTGERLWGFDVSVYLAMAASGMPARVGSRRWAALWVLVALGVRSMVVA